MPGNKPDLFQLVKIYQIDSHLRICWKYNKNKCRFSYGCFFTSKTVITKSLETGKKLTRRIKF